MAIGRDSNDVSNIIDSIWASEELQFVSYPLCVGPHHVFLRAVGEAQENRRRDVCISATNAL